MDKSHVIMDNIMSSIEKIRSISESSNMPMISRLNIEKELLVLKKSILDNSKSGVTGQPAGTLLGQEMIRAIIRSNEGLTIEELHHLFPDVVQRTIRRHLLVYVNSGTLATSKVGRIVYYKKVS